MKLFALLLGILVITPVLALDVELDDLTIHADTYQQTLSRELAGARDTGHVTHEGVKLTRAMDEQSAGLAQAAVEGTTYKTVTVHLPLAPPLQLQQAAIASYNVYVAGDDRPREELLLVYQELAWDVTGCHDAPFDITVTPKKATVVRGEEVGYAVQITADEGFTQSIDVVADVDMPFHKKQYALGTYEEFPYEKKGTIPIPDSALADITTDVVIRAQSGEECDEEIITVTVDGPIPFVGSMLAGLSSAWDTVTGWF
ncbi:MAG: type VI secretion system tube protein Hcp [Candidatus Woesearchaeota archaeon]|nr:type VI secretion system tube protein Hcp [Candidatus Woesearchaeota archaeon]